MHFIFYLFEIYMCNLFMLWFGCGNVIGKVNESDKCLYNKFENNIFTIICLYVKLDKSLYGLKRIPKQ